MSPSDIPTGCASLTHAGGFELFINEGPTEGDRYPKLLEKKGLENDGW